MKHFFFTTLHIIVLLTSAIWTRNYLGDVYIAANGYDLDVTITLFDAVMGCIMSVIFTIACFLLLLTAPAKEAQARSRRNR